MVFDASQTVLLVNVGARGQVLLSCPLAVRQPGVEQLELMARHNFLHAAGGTVLCTAEDGQVHAQLGLPVAECMPERLLAAIEALLAEADRWRLRLSRASPDRAVAKRPPAWPAAVAGRM